MIVVKIILVDDHDMFLNGVKNVLSEQKELQVLGAYNTVKAALKALEKETPDLLITDIAMPDINGLEFVKIIKQRYPKLKILVVSMFKQIQSFEGVNGYLLKETSYEELIKAIKSIVIEEKNYFYEDLAKNEAKLEFNKTILTTREKQIIRLIADELTVDDIAEKLFLSKHTVETHKKNIFQKLQVNNAVGLIKKAIYLGYID